MEMDEGISSGQHTVMDEGISSGEHTVTTNMTQQQSRDEDKNPTTTQPEFTTEDSEIVQYSHNTTLHKACEKGKLNVVKYILSQGLEHIDSREKRTGRTPVMMAAREGHFKVFDYLVTQGSDLSSVDDYSNNALHVACMGGNTDIVRKLIVSEKLDIESRGRLGRRPVMWAARYGRREVLKLLVKKGCDLTAVDDHKNNILHIACFSGNIDIVQYILSRNIVSIESKGQLGRTPLLSAAITGRKYVFDFLLGKGSNLRAIADTKNNILHIACVGGNIDIVQYILSQHIVSIESRGHYGHTPVMTAAMMGKKGVFDFLVKKGCKLTSLDNEGNNILHVACIGGDVNMVKYLITLRVMEGMAKARNKYDLTPVQVANEYGHVAVVRLFRGRK